MSVRSSTTHPPVTPDADRARVAVVGGGAIGSYLSTLAHDAGNDVTLCVRTPFERLVVEQDGRRRDVPVAIASSPDGLPAFDWLVVATKGQDTAGTAPWLSALADARTTVVVAQNGVSHRERVQPLAPASSILPALIYITVEPIERGHVRHSVGNRIVTPEAADADRFAALLHGSGVEVSQDPSFLTAAWRKFLGNVVGNPITALTLRRAEVFRDDGIAELSAVLLAEAIAVGRAEGAEFDDDEQQQTVDLFRNVPPQNGTSMLFDRIAGRPLEHELITGHVVALGRRHGIPTPANDVVLALISALDAGIRNAR